VSAPVPLALVPRDGFFCKDGRGWFTSESGRGHGLAWPWPSTVLGALRTAWGRGLEKRQGGPMDGNAWRTRTASITLGRSLALRRRLGATWSGDQRVWPVPLDAHWLEGQARVTRLDPAPSLVPTLGRDDDDAREALWVATADGAAKPLPSPHWWSERCFAAWLAGDPVSTDAQEDHFSPASRLQAHVGIRPAELTADDGALFEHDVVETLERQAEWALGVEVVLPDEDTPALARLGSDGRLARIDVLPSAIFEPPDALLEAFGTNFRGIRLVVVTPACFEQGWLPDGLKSQDGEIRGRLPALEPEVVLRAAMVPRPVHISGWDMAAGVPKPTSRMVAPGAVYFFERADGGAFGVREARTLWLAAAGARTDEGFGRLVPGTWSPNRS
jgi:CRISPR-associated protein Cmr3